MSSASRAPGDKPVEAEPQPKRADPSARSPGRYSLSTEGSTEMAAVRIDSTRMAAVRPEDSAPPSSRNAAPLPPPLPPPPRAAPITVPPPAGAKTAPLIAGRRGTLPQVPAAPAISEPPPPTRGTGAEKLASARPDALPTQPNIAPPTRSSSRRPPPPAKKTPSVQPGALESFDFDEGSIAAAFDDLLSEGSIGVAGIDTQTDLAPVRELFAELAANHMRHVRDFMIDVKWGEAPREWIDICIPAVASLRRAAERLDIAELATGLDSFAAQLEDTKGGTARTIEGETKEKLLASYDGLVAALPTAFALDRDKSQREAVIIQSLCLSVPDVRKVTIDKLHSAGLMSLQTLFEAKPDEVAQVAGIPESLALRIVERFQEYRHELQNASPQDARAAERDRLATLTASLREQHDGYEEAALGWSPEAKAKKRDLFRAREETWLSISLLLARFGEVERIQGIERVPFSQRITQLTDYLEEARQNIARSDDRDDRDDSTRCSHPIVRHRRKRMRRGVSLLYARYLTSREMN